MRQPLTSKRKMEAISNGIFLIGLGILFYTNAWWPGILLVIWAALGLRQLLSRRIYDLFLSTLILVGLFILSFFKLDWAILIPVLFVVGGIFIIFREYFFSEDTNGEEKSQEILDDTDDVLKPK